MAQDFLNLFLESFVENLPQLLWATLVFLTGLLVSKWSFNIVARFLGKIRFNQAL